MDTLIDLLRHGETEGAQGFLGWSDPPLSSRGFAQMQKAARGRGPWDAVISSPLQRCAAFARGLAGESGVPFFVDEDLREMGFGSWEGISAHELWAREPAAVASFYQDPENYSPPGGEPMTDFRHRVLRGWRQASDLHAGQRILIVGHGGAIRVILAEVLRMPADALMRIETPHACLSRIRIPQAGSASLVFHEARS